MGLYIKVIDNPDLLEKSRIIFFNELIQRLIINHRINFSFIQRLNQFRIRIKLSGIDFRFQVSVNLLNRLIDLRPVQSRHNSEFIVLCIFNRLGLILRHDRDYDFIRLIHLCFCHRIQRIFRFNHINASKNQHQTHQNRNHFSDPVGFPAKLKPKAYQSQKNEDNADYHKVFQRQHIQNK